MARKKQNNRKQPIRPKRKKLKAKTENQEDYIAAMAECDVTFCSGPAGSGKTAVAVGLACEYVLENKIEKIIITRPVVEAGRGLGHLPGTLTEKVSPYLVPILEEMKLYLGMDTFNSMRATNTIELCPLEYMRGRNFHNAFMILDEAQNATFEQNGDLDQTDLRGEAGGLYDCMDALTDLEGVAICGLTDDDIVRNGIISKILGRLR
jgi:phosphate starvation-inducible PhoH-like protein